MIKLKLNDFDPTEFNLKETDIYELNIDAISGFLGKRNEYASIASRIRRDLKENNLEPDGETIQDLLYLDLMYAELDEALDIIWGFSELEQFKRKVIIYKFEEESRDKNG